MEAEGLIFIAIKARLFFLIFGTGSAILLILKTEVNILELMLIILETESVILLILETEDECRNYK